MPYMQHTALGRITGRAPQPLSKRSRKTTYNGLSTTLPPVFSTTSSGLDLCDLSDASAPAHVSARSLTAGLFGGGFAGGVYWERQTRLLTEGGVGLWIDDHVR